MPGVDGEDRREVVKKLCSYGGTRRTAGAQEDEEEEGEEAEELGSAARAAATAADLPADGAHQ